MRIGGWFSGLFVSTSVVFQFAPWIWIILCSIPALWLFKLGYKTGDFGYTLWATYITLLGFMPRLVLLITLAIGIWTGVVLWFDM